jgi:hypothetical protein
LAIVSSTTRQKDGGTITGAAANKKLGNLDLLPEPNDPPG